MRISEAARRLGMSPRMLRYREDLGLLPRVRGTGPGPGRGPRHRQFGESDLRAVHAALQLERRYQISPAALAFGLRVLAEPGVRAAVADLSRRLGHLPEQPGRALDFEQERALRLLRLSGGTPSGGTAQSARSSGNPDLAR
jgi:MerR family transcriptional regulator, copper efflux regulator